VVEIWNTKASEMKVDWRATCRRVLHEKGFTVTEMLLPIAVAGQWRDGAFSLKFLVFTMKSCRTEFCFVYRLPEIPDNCHFLCQHMSWIDTEIILNVDIFSLLSNFYSHVTCDVALYKEIKRRLNSVNAYCCCLQNFLSTHFLSVT